jgi:hypothetical protein
MDNKPDKPKDKSNDKVPLLYLYIFKMMIEKIGNDDQVVESKQLLEVWHRNIYNVPRCYDFHILTEMCDYGLIKRINTLKYVFYGNKGQTKLRRLKDFFLWS